MGRTVFLGTSEFAVAVLERLAASPYAPQLVVSRPDRPRGRGRRLGAPPVATAARRLGIELDQPDSVNGAEARARIVAVNPEAVCVCAFGALIKEPLLHEHRMLNVHPSLLPRWRGAAPIERAIMAGDERTGVSIMSVSAGLDSGPVGLQAPVWIGPQDTYGSLAPRLAELGGELLVRALEEQPEAVEQDDQAATYAEKIKPEDRWLDPDRAAVELERQVRALTPHVGTYVELADRTRLRVDEARVIGSGPGTPPAGVVSLQGTNPVLGCAEDALELTIVRPAGRRSMRGEEYLRGLR